MRVLILGKVWPEPASTAAGRRTADLLEAVASLSRDVHFATSAKKNDFSLDMQAMHVVEHVVHPNNSHFDTWLKELSPDIVIFDRFMIEEQYGWRVETICPAAVKILDTSDLHCLREARKTALKTHQPPDIFNEIALREIASIHRCDCTLVISKYEYTLLQGEFMIPETQLFYWPFLSDGLRPGAKKCYAERSNFVMIGSLMHAPNLDGVRWCRDTIWPLIRTVLPEVELHCYGSYGEKYAAELNRPDMGFHFRGRAESVLDTLSNYRVNLAALRFGAGLKGKLFDGFEAGTACVTTPIGAEGIALETEWGCVISAIEEQFAAAAVGVYTDPKTWRQVVDCGASTLEKCFKRSHWLGQFRQRLAQIVSERDANRSRNFTGRMLRHHRHRSTEFMSRWIEAKNR